MGGVDVYDKLWFGATFDALVVRRSSPRSDEQYLCVDKGYDYADIRLSATRRVLGQVDRIDLHLLPKDSPDCNPIERVRWTLHDRITRNHQCETIEELLDLTFAWLGSRNPFKIEDKVYRAAA